jgi:antirestriction protein
MSIRSRNKKETVKTMSKSTSVEPSIYVACLSAYNNGKLHGAWIDCAGTTVDTIQEQIDAMLAASPEPDAEEYAIHDYAGFGSYKVSEHADLDKLVELADLLTEHEEVAVVVTEFETDIERIKLLCEEGYAGEYQSKSEWAEEFLTDTGSLPDSKLVRDYFNYEAYARDCELSGGVDFVEVGYNKVLVFDGRI